MASGGLNFSICFTTYIDRVQLNNLIIKTSRKQPSSLTCENALYLKVGNALSYPQGYFWGLRLDRLLSISFNHPSHNFMDSENFILFFSLKWKNQWWPNITLIIESIWFKFKPKTIPFWSELILSPAGYELRSPDHEADDIIMCNCASPSIEVYSEGHRTI